MAVTPKKCYTYFRNRFVLKSPSSTGFYRMECPFCVSSTGSTSLAGSVNFGWMRYSCFRCDYAEYIPYFVADYEGISYKEAKAKIEGEETSAIDLEVFENVRVIKVSDIELPVGFTPILEGSGILGVRARNYLKGRGFDLDYLDMLGFGYCREKPDLDEKDPMYKELNYYGYIIVPFKKDGALRYFIGRDFIGNYLRYKNPSKDTFGVGKSELFFNEDAFQLRRNVYISEGWADAMTMGKGGTSSQGWSLSKDQKSVMHLSTSDRFIFLPDVGFYKQAVSIAREFMDRREVRVVDFEAHGYSIESKTKDVNEIGRNTVMKLIKKTPPLTERLAMEILTE